MYRVSPASPYRLRTLAQTDAHLYQVGGSMFGLQMLGLVVATGPADPDLKKVEYSIADDSRAKFEGQHGLSSSSLSDGEARGGWSLIARVAVASP